MADPEHLKIFKQGVAAWNRWRQKNRGLTPDLSGADLKRANFRYANLNDANLEYANLEGANFDRAFLEGAGLQGALQRGAHFFSADLRHADLRRADLRQAQLWHAHLDRADLRGAMLAAADLRSCELAAADLRAADLQAANLAGADLLRSDLRGANLTGANLHGTKLIGSRLDDADLSTAAAALTTWSGIDLSRIRGLDTVRHDRPSSIGIDTLTRTEAGLDLDPARRGPVTGFLRGAGVPEHYLALAVAGRATAATIYIAHSLADRAFARRLYDELQARGRRCWLDQRPMLPGDGLDDSYDLGPRRYQALILCFSAAAQSSWWLGAELDEAAEHRRQLTADCGLEAEILLPICLGGSEAIETWDRLSSSRHLPPLVADFSAWERDQASFARALEALIEGLEGAI